MTWVAWRQFRTQALVTLGLLAAFAVLVLISGLHLRDVLVWTQSVTRRRWLSVRVTLVGAAALAVAGLASWLVGWWFAPLDAVSMDRFDPSVFTTRGIVAIGYAGFAFALGVIIGTLTRRTLPAMAATLLTFVGTRIAFTLWIRPHLLAPVHTTQPVGAGENTGILASPHGVTLFAGSPTIPDGWVYSGAIVENSGAPASAGRIHALLHALCPKIGTPQAPPPGAVHHVNAVPAPGGLFEECMAKLSHHVRVLVTYQPPSHYWPLQALETAAFLAAALLLIAATIWDAGRRTTRPSPGRRTARGA